MSDASLPPRARSLPPAVSVAARTAATGETALQQAARLMEHLKKQLEELDRREANLNRQLIAFDNERRSLRLLSQQVEAESAHREQQLATREEEVAAREATSAARASELEALEKHLGERERTLEQQRLDLRASVEQELASQRAELIEQSAEIARREAAVQAQLDEIDQSVVDLEKRRRLHEDHLARLRAEIATERASFERETAQRRIWLAEQDHVSSLRLAQLRRVRGLLDRREASLAAEAGLLREQEAAAIESIAREREALQRDQEELARAVEEHARDVERHEEMQTLQAQNLEGRRQRLDRLREELDQERQELLESRLVVEQVFSQTVHALDVPAAQERVQTARSKLFEYYRELREALTRRRQDCESAQRQLVERRDAFQLERDEQLQRVAEREEELENQGLSLTQRAREFAAREREFAQARERWRRERLEAEQVIRSLLSELEQQQPAVSAPSAAADPQSAGSRIVPLPPDEFVHETEFENSPAAETPPDRRARAA